MLRRLVQVCMDLCERLPVDVICVDFGVRCRIEL